MKRLMTAFILMCSLTACSWQSDQQQAKQVIHQFYDADSHIRPQGALTLDELLSVRNYLSVPLFELLKDVSEIQEANFHRSDSYVDPLIDGDPFTSDINGQTDYRIIHCALQEKKEDTQLCRIELHYKDNSTGTDTRWEDQILLTRDVRGWIIDNVIYGGEAPPLRSGNLHMLLLDILSSTDAPDDLSYNN